MRHLTASLFCFALAVSSCVSGKDFPSVQQAPKSFENLGKALQFIAECLDQDAYARLSGMCIGGHKPDAVYLAQHRRPFNMLKAAHKEKPLLDRYSEREFPKTGDQLKLGGHMSELGCLHIDFVKKDHKWFLSDIWDCK